MGGSAILLPFPVSVEPGVFRERAERSAGRQQPPMGQDTLWNGEKKKKHVVQACKETTFK